MRRGTPAAPPEHLPAVLPSSGSAPEVADVEQFVPGTEPDDTAGLRTATAAGSTPLTAEADAEDVLRLHLLR